MLKKGWQGPLPVIAAVVIVASLSLLTVSVMSGLGGDDDDFAVVDTEGADTSTTSTWVRPTTTTTTRPTTTIPPAPGTDAPEVLGETTEREPEATTTSTGAPAPVPAPAPTSTPAAPSPTTTSTTSTPPETTTTTTTLACRNSTDPACGPLEWDPEPGPYEVEVYAVSVPTTARVGREVVFAVNRVEPAGDDALGACTSWQVSDPGVVSISTCEAVNAECGRYGPHDPPPPSRHEVTLSESITFTEPGEHTVTVSGNTATHLGDGCPSPYLESWSRTFTIIVED